MAEPGPERMATSNGRRQSQPRPGKDARKKRRSHGWRSTAHRCTGYRVRKRAGNKVDPALPSSVARQKRTTWRCCPIGASLFSDHRQAVKKRQAAVGQEELGCLKYNDDLP